MEKLLSQLTGYTYDETTGFNFDTFKNWFAAKFISREAALTDADLINKITGKRINAFETKFIRAFGLQADEVKNKRLEEILDTAVTKHNATVEELKTQLNTGTDERIAELNNQLGERSKSVDELTAQLSATNQAFETYKTESAGKFKSYKIGEELNKIYASLNFIDGFDSDEVRRAGFNSLISNKYVFDLDADDNLVVTDKAGKPVKYPAKPNEAASAITVLTQEAESNNLLKKNNAKPVVVHNRTGLTISADNKIPVANIPLHKRAAARVK